MFAAKAGAKHVYGVSLPSLRSLVPSELKLTTTLLSIDRHVQHRRPGYQDRRCQRFQGPFVPFPPPLPPPNFELARTFKAHSLPSSRFRFVQRSPSSRESSRIPSSPSSPLISSSPRFVAFFLLCLLFSFCPRRASSKLTRRFCFRSFYSGWDTSCEFCILSLYREYRGGSY